MENNLYYLNTWNTNLYLKSHFPNSNYRILVLIWFADVHFWERPLGLILKYESYKYSILLKFEFYLFFIL